MPAFVNGKLNLEKKCIPNALQRRPYPPRSTSLDDLKDEIDELKDEVGRLKAKGNCGRSRKPLRGWAKRSQCQSTRCRRSRQPLA